MSEAEKLAAIATATEEAKTVAGRLSLRDVIAQILKDQQMEGGADE